ncbi:type 1 glutamine amidotransferase domain-containing protein [Spiroplasma endosymbiont of Crioceris asparagi]|uniref:type 1 glutamine amidotransferase domain-containing protein n=1 Tax=Spiroplasma endosymbiont of Crioceris asparagi TaxID=3066286 RepID=UPI0030D61D58
MKKILVVLTNIDHYGNSDVKTGLWLSEATDFVDIMQGEDFLIDYISPKGGRVPLDPVGMSFATERDLEILNSKDFQERAIQNSLTPSDVNPKDYAAIYYTGGHGVMWDFAKNEALDKLALEIYKNDGFITSVCHGVAGLLWMKDKKGNYFIKDKEITGFTDQEEILSKKEMLVPFSNEKVGKENEAKFIIESPFKPFVVKDDRIITGQNPQSAKLVAEWLLNELTKNND